MRRGSKYAFDVEPVVSQSLETSSNAAQIEYWNATGGETWAQFQESLDRQIVERPSRESDILMLLARRFLRASVIANGKPWALTGMSGLLFCGFFNCAARRQFSTQMRGRL